MFARPRPENTEKDLLTSQEQFVTGCLHPSAVVCRSSRRDKLDSTAVVGDKREHSTRREVVRDVVTLDGVPSTQPFDVSSPGFPPKKKSRFKDRNNTKKANILNHGEEEVDAAELLEINDRHLSTVLSQIQERDVQCGSVNVPLVSHSGFPSVLHRHNVMEHGTLSSNDRSSKSAKSLFAQQFSLMGGVSFGVLQHTVRNDSMGTTELKDETIKTHKGTRKFEKSLVITGEGLRHHTGQQEILTDNEVEKIHQENVAKLASMTQEEIKEEQARLRVSLDPSLVAFLTSRHKRSEIMQDDDPTGQDVGKEHSKSDDSKDSMSKKQNIVNKHVHFSGVEMISSESGEEDIADQQSDEGVRIGDLKLSEKWLHMDTVESDKLKWMKDCPLPMAVKSKGGQQARFDFSGHLVSKSEDIPEYLGLHHHGNEPSSAGYTLEELFILARSSFLQQRVVALQVLARIIRQDHQGTFEGCLQEDVLSVLLGAGLLFLLRWSLDDSTEAVMTAAVQGLNTILTVPRDKEKVEKVFSFPHGLELPSLSPLYEKKEKSTSKEDKEEERNMTDAELLKKDVVKGLIQMRLLPRLRYILEVCCPAAPAVLDILSILTRISQHSTQTASEVFQCPHLLEAIIENFLPMSWSAPVKGNNNVYHLPLSDAMRLMKTLCSAGRNMAVTLINKYDLIGRVLRYTALDPQDIQMELEEAHLLYIESLRAWRVCILYGLSCNIVREMYTTFIDQLKGIQCLSLLTPGGTSRLSCATAIFGIIEAAVYAAGSNVAPDHKDVEGAFTPEQDSRWPLSLNWSHVAGLMPLIVECATQNVKEVLESENPVLEDENLALMSGVFAVLTSFYSKLQNQVSYSPVDALQQIERLTCLALLPLVESNIFSWCFNSISCRSSYNMRTRSKLCIKQIPCLPRYGSVEPIMETGPQSDKNSTCVLVGFVTSVLQLLYQVTKLHKGITTKFTSFLCKEAILDYLNLVQEAGLFRVKGYFLLQSRGLTLETILDASLSFFARQEHHLQYFLIKLFHNVIEGSTCEEMTSYIPLWHDVSLLLLSKFISGDEFYAYDLLSTVLFNFKFFLRINDPLSLGVTRDLSQMSLSTKGCSTPLLATTSDVATLSRTELVSEALKNLPQIRSTFMGAFHDVKLGLPASRSLYLHEVRNIKSFLLPLCSGPLLPQDWMFLPLVELHNQAFGVEMKGRNIDTLTDPAISIVTTTLQLVLLLEEWRPLCLRHVSMTARVVRLLCVFLTGNDLFLNKGVHTYMSCLLRIYSHPNNLGKLDFSSPIPGITSIYDLYASLLSQYSAVSFGDALFACFVVLPLTQRHDPKFRRAVLDEHIGVLRALSLPLDQLPVSLDEFLYPVEQSASLLSLYLRALATESVRPQWSPLFYLMAVHHMNSFIFQRVDLLDPLAIERKVTLLRQVLALKNESVRNDILYYHKPADTRTSQLLEKFANLPPDRELLLRHRDSCEQCHSMKRFHKL